MEEEEHVYFIAYEECEAAGYVSIQPQGKDLFHLQKIYVLPYYQGAHCGSFLFREAVKYIKEIHPEPCMLELNVNRNNKALHFYEHMGMKKLREGDFPIGNGYFLWSTSIPSYIQFVPLIVFPYKFREISAMPVCESIHNRCLLLF